MNLTCEMCGKITALSESQCARIKSELARSGVGAAHIWNCSCGRFQIVLRLAPETPRWNLVEAAK
jgi:hypothetical protein